MSVYFNKLGDDGHAKLPYHGFNQDGQVSRTQSIGKEKINGGVNLTEAMRDQTYEDLSRLASGTLLRPVSANIAVVAASSLPVHAAASNLPSLQQSHFIPTLSKTK